MESIPIDASADIREETVNGVRMRMYYPRPASLNQVLDDSVARWGNRECLVFNQVRWTFSEFNRKVRETAESLTFYGIQPGDRVGLLMENRLEFAVGYYAAQQVGAIAVVLNARLKSDKLGFMLHDSGTKLLMVEHAIWQTLEDLPSNLRTVVELGGDGGGHTVPWEIFAANRRPYALPPIDEAAPAALLYTSGTTGVPKGAVQSHRNLISNAMNATRLMGVTPEDRTLVVAPLFHATAVNSQLTAMLYAGATSVIRPYFKTDDFMMQLEKEKISIAIGVATMFWFLLDSPLLAERDLSSLRYIVYGGSPAPVDLIRRLKTRFPAVRLGNVWGLTESTSIATMLPDDKALAKPDSVGIATPTMEVRVDPLSRDGGVGELLIKGPSVITGYWNNTRATEGTIVDGWLKTGDVGRIDEDGYIYVMDRIKDMIIRGGQNIYSIEVENVLFQHPTILEAAVFGVPDDVWGERVKAVVVLKPGQSATPQEIREYCQSALARYMVPEFVDITDALPRNPGGKVLKDALRTMGG